MLKSILVAATLFSSVASYATVSTDSEIREFKLNSCLPGKTACVSASSPLASGSFLRPVYSFDTLDVEMTSKNKNLKWKAARGWFDLENNQLVVIDKNKKETVIYLDSMNVFEPET